MFICTKAGYLPVRSIQLIEDPVNGFHPIHYCLGSGLRETEAHEQVISQLLNYCEDKRELAAKKLSSYDES